MKASRATSQPRAELVASLTAAGVPHADARRVIAAFRINAYRAALGRISTKAAVRANESLLCRVLAVYMPRRAVAA